MCTVVFIPGKDACYFASLRDEDPLRQGALLPKIYQEDNIRYLSPLDPAGNGTWIGINECGHVIILLNGGFFGHLKEGMYAKSRGAIVRELLSDEMPVIAWSLMDLNRIETVHADRVGRSKTFSIGMGWTKETPHISFQ